MELLACWGIEGKLSETEANRSCIGTGGYSSECLSSSSEVEEETRLRKRSSNSISKPGWFKLRKRGRKFRDL
jgi:hypothetical protein